MINYKTIGLVNGKPKQIIVDESGKIVNKNPNKDELKGVEKECYKQTKAKIVDMYTDKNLFDYLIQFEKENGRVPVVNDFMNNSKYPTKHVFINRFGSWSKALEMAGLYDKRIRRTPNKYTDTELLDFLTKFYDEHGRSPTQTDFDGISEYPSSTIYLIRFGKWNKALELVELDVDTRVLQGSLKTNQEKARYAELKVKNHFKKHPIDLAGENYLSHCDGICPNGKIYDVKSSGLRDNRYYFFNIRNKYKEEIELYYLLAFNKDYSKLEYVWRVPGEIIEKDYIRIGVSHAEFTIESMKEYDITDKFRNIIEDQVR